MDFVGILAVERNRVIKLLQCIAGNDTATLYLALRDADNKLQTSLFKFLSRNNLPGADKAMQYLTEVQDPVNACRAAITCLMISREKN